MHFQHQLSCGVGNLVFSLWKHTPAWEVHFLLCHELRCVQGKPGNGKQKFCLKILSFDKSEAAHEKYTKVQLVLINLMNRESLRTESLLYTVFFMPTIINIEIGLHTEIMNIPESCQGDHVNYCPAKVSHLA